MLKILKKLQNNAKESSNEGDKDDDWGNVDWPAENSEISEFTGFPSSDPFENNDRRKSRSSSVDRDSPSSHAGVSFNDWDSDFESVDQNEVVTKDEAFDQGTEMDSKAKTADEQDVFSAFDVTNSGDEDDEEDVFDTVLEDSNNAKDAKNDIVDDPFAEENFEAAESANPFNSTENPFATAEALETNTDEQGNSGSGWDDIWDKIEGKSSRKNARSGSSGSKFVENNIQKSRPQSMHDQVQWRHRQTNCERDHVLGWWEYTIILPRRSIICEIREYP